MTKKTDSLIFRYGVQTLWNNTNFLFKTCISSSFFFKFLYFELQKYNLELLSVEQKKNNLIYVFVFCSFWKSSLMNVKKKYGQTFFLFKFILFYKYWFIFKALYNIFYFLVNVVADFKLNQFFFNFYLSLTYLIFCNRLSFYKTDYNYICESQTLNTLFFKTEQLRLESILFFFFNRHFKIKLSNIFNLPIYFDFIQKLIASKNSAIVSLTNLEFILYLSCKLRVISIFTRYLAKTLELENRHRKVLWSVIAAVSLLNKNLSLFKGIRIYVTGKLNGKMRRKTYSFKFGHVGINKISNRLDYFKSSSFTKFGVISVKTWVFFD